MYNLNEDKISQIIFNNVFGLFFASICSFTIIAVTYKRYQK